MHSKLLEMQVSCFTVQDVGRMVGRFAAGGQERQQENLLLKTMLTRGSKEESARQLEQNDSATMKIQRFSSAVEVPHAVRPTRPLERMQAEPSRDHRQALLNVLTISLRQERWKSKDVFLITKDAVRKHSQTMRSRTSEDGTRRRQNKGLGRPRLCQCVVQE